MSDVENLPQNPMDYLNKNLAKVPDFTPPTLTSQELCPIPAACSKEEENQYCSAAAFMKAISQEALAWRSKLPKNFRPAIMAVLHGGIQVQVQSLAQVSFDGIRIEGNMQGGPCSLLAHQSTVQMLCYAEEIKDEIDLPRKRAIGFIWPDNTVEV
jgi:hypothetical protein